MKKLYSQLQQGIIYLSTLALLIICTGLLHAGETNPPAYVDIQVKETAGMALSRPVSGGVPIAEGLAPENCNFVLLDARNKPVPCQTQVLAQWKDGSARWVLLDFQSDPQQGGVADYRLTWDKNAKEVNPAVPVRVNQGKDLTLDAGRVMLKTVPEALLRIADRFDVKFVLTDSKGVRCEAVLESSKIELEGKVRSTLILSGEFRNPQGARVIDFRLRASVFAGLGQLYLEPQIIVNADEGMITSLNDLSLEIIPLAGIQSASIGGQPGWEGDLSSQSSLRLFQVDDQNYHFEGSSTGSGKQAPGWMTIDDGKGAIALTLRDFWQQWPKSLEVDKKGAKLGLFPAFEAGAFDHMEPWYKYDYLFEGNSYRLREGQSRRWQVWLDIDGEGAELAKSVNKPLIPIANPYQAIRTGEWGPVAAAGSEGMAEYDRWADELFEGYCNSIQEQRDYGAMNWGDWWGERGVNWGNNEYDTPLHIFTQFARTGDPKYFYVAEQAARHYSEVDVVHAVNEELKTYFSRWERPEYPSRPGMVHEHSIGHVGGFHPVEKIRELYVSKRISGGNPNPYLCLDPYNLGHIWTLGMAHYYLLTGDPWVKETVEQIGENLMKLTEDGQYKFKGTSHSGRVNGWTMLALAGLYKINPSERCLNAMRFIADEALVEQNPHSGGWLYELPWGHCNCVSIADRKKGVTPHVGEAGFITSVRLNGLSYYYRLTGDPRIPESLLKGVTNLNNDTWNDYKKGWRYTSCPATMKSVGQSGVTIMALVNSVSINHDPEHLRVLREAWGLKFKKFLEDRLSAKPGLGKTYSTIMYGSPEAMNLFVNGLKEKE